MDQVKKEGVDNSLKFNINKPLTEQELGKKRFPKELIPTQKTMFAFEIIFLLILILGFGSIPMDSLFSGNFDFEISIGWPLAFFELNMSIDEDVPDDISIIQWGGLILDCLIYLIIGYAADVMINISWDKTFNKKKKKGKNKSAPEKSMFNSLYLTFFPEKKPQINNQDVL